MKVSRKTIVVGTLVAISMSGLTAIASTEANAANKKITCYKGTAVKQVTTAKCPTGWSTKKPVAKPAASTPAKVTPSASASATPSASTPAASNSGSQKIDAKYTGKMSVVWSDTGVQASKIDLDGSGTTLGLTALTGSGSSSPSSQCDTVSGTGVLSGGGNTLKVTFDSASKVCGDEGAAPTNVKINGHAVVNGGTGKYAGATGNLVVTGNFYVKSTEAGSTDSPTLTLNISGTITTK